MARIAVTAAPTPQEVPAGSNIGLAPRRAQVLMLAPTLGQTTDGISRNRTESESVEAQFVSGCITAMIYGDESRCGSAQHEKRSVDPHGR
jgi:hypothetical protein